MSQLVELIKQIALDELRAKGYAPNPADVVGLATKAAELIAGEVANAMAEVKAAQVPTPVVTPVVMPPKP